MRIPETDDRLVEAAAYLQLEGEELALSVPERRGAWRAPSRRSPRVPARSPRRRRRTTSPSYSGARCPSSCTYAEGARCLLSVLDKAPAVFQPLLLALVRGHVAACDSCGIASDPDRERLLRDE